MFNLASVFLSFYLVLKNSILGLHKAQNDLAIDFMGSPVRMALHRSPSCFMDFAQPFVTSAPMPAICCRVIASAAVRPRPQSLPSVFRDYRLVEEKEKKAPCLLCSFGTSHIEVGILFFEKETFLHSG